MKLLPYGPTFATLPEGNGNFWFPGDPDQSMYYTPRIHNTVIDDRRKTFIKKFQRERMARRPQDGTSTASTQRSQPQAHTSYKIQHI